MIVNKYETKQPVYFGDTPVQIIEWEYNTDTNVIRYYVENRQTGFKAWVLEDRLTLTKPTK